MTDLEKAREFCKEVKNLSEKYGLDFFMVTEGASITKSTKGNSAIKNARQSQIRWERENGFDPNEDWNRNKSL